MKKQGSVIVGFTCTDFIIVRIAVLNNQNVPISTFGFS